MSQFSTNRGGRPSKGDREPIMVRVPADLKPRLQAVAKARGTSVSDLISGILEEWIDEAEIEAGLPHQVMFDLEKTG